MTALQFLAFCNQALKGGAITPETEIVVAQPGDVVDSGHLRAWPTFGVSVISGTAREVGAEPAPLLVIAINLIDDDEEEDDE